LTGPGTNIDDRLKNLSPAQAALLQKRLLERQAAKLSADAIPRRQTSNPHPLSYAQELLWLLDQLTPGSIAYNSPDAVRLRGRFDSGALQRALDRLVARNEILRTVYRTVNGEPAQVVLDAAPVPLETVDLANLDPDKQEPELQRLLKERSEQPFDLHDGPVFRAMLVRLGEEDHVLLTVIHHIATDGWSKGVTWRELSSLYILERDAGKADVGGVDALPDPPIQYTDFAAWQRERLSEARLEAQLSYWRDQLSGAPAVLELPTDRPRPAVQTYAGDHQNLLIDRRVLEGLNELARQEGATLFMVLLAAFDTLLARYSGRDDIVVGTPIAGRNRVETESMIGYFMNTLALRTSLEGDPTFRDLVRRVKEVTLDAFAHQEVPFEKVVIEIRPERDLSFSPVFQVMMVLQNQKRGALKFADFETEVIGHERAWSKFDLTLGMGERPEGLNTSWEYSTDLFDDVTITRMMGHFAALLVGIVEDPDRPVSALPILPEPERADLLARGTAVGDLVATATTLHGLVSAQAARTPNVVAVIDGARSLTYRELDERSSQLARYLQTIAPTRGALIGVFLDRSVELAVGLLGVLKSGAACVPLDTAYPPDRLALMLNDARCPIVVTAETLLGKLPPVPARAVAVDGDWPHIARQASDVEGAGIDPDSMAYAVYTSGSTGLPKGVELTHRGLVNHTLAVRNLFGITADDRVLQFASISFDISIEELFPAWSRGATVVMRPSDLPIAGPEFLRYLHDQAITVLDLPTAFWHEWVNDLDAQGAAVPATLRALVVGGEKASAAVHATWLRLGGGDVRWFNTYGPTEASVIVTCHEADARAVDDVPLGRPLPNTRLLVLDGRRHLVPIGVPGELYIGGVGVAAGYRGQPELSAESFLADPFPPPLLPEGSPPWPGRLYRTGDLVRWRADGSLEFVGRADNQVKIRGFRIEPGEVESALCQHPGVNEALVVAANDHVGATRLVAYVICGEEPHPTSRDLRAFLAQRLPGYMVPSAFLALPTFPKTPNGKVDRDALPIPEPALPETGTYVAPRTPVEARVAELWGDLLGTSEPIGVHDDFFALGGHSLLAVRLFAVLEREFGCRLPLATIFQGATIEDLAVELGADKPHADGWKSMILLKEGAPGRRPLFLAPSLNGVAMGRDLVKYLDPTQPVYALQNKGLDGSYPHRTIPEMAEWFLDEMRQIQPQGPYMLGGFCFGGAVALEMAAQLARQGEEISLLALFEVTGRDATTTRPTAFERERAKWRKFLNGSPSEKAAWIGRRGRNARTKLERRVWWKAFERYARDDRPLPRFLQNVRRVNVRALNTFVAPSAPCRTTIFQRGDLAAGDAFYNGPLRDRLGAVGIDVRIVADASIGHVEMICEPAARYVARDLMSVIETQGLRPTDRAAGRGPQ
jgi:aspartate racemase